jgi:hypothetical protein
MIGARIYFVAAKLTTPEAYNNGISNVEEGQATNIDVRIDSYEE